MARETGCLLNRPHLPGRSGRMADRVGLVWNFCFYKFFVYAA
jgi:hypothetical protein